MPTTLCPSVTSSDSPCAMPSVPSVVMNGGMPTTAISTPLREAEARSDRQRRQEGERRRAGRDHRDGKHDGREGEHRADRQVEALGHDDERHRQREQQQDRRLREDVRDIGRRRKSRAWSAPKTAHSTTSTMATPGTRAIGRAVRLKHARAHWCIPRRTILASVSSWCASSPAMRPLRIT